MRYLILVFFLIVLGFEVSAFTSLGAPGGLLPNQTAPQAWNDVILNNTNTGKYYINNSITFDTNTTHSNDRDVGFIFPYSGDGMKVEFIAPNNNIATYVWGNSIGEKIKVEVSAGSSIFSTVGTTLDFSTINAFMDINFNSGEDISFTATNNNITLDAGTTGDTYISGGRILLRNSGDRIMATTNNEIQIGEIPIGKSTLFGTGFQKYVLMGGGNIGGIFGPGFLDNPVNLTITLQYGNGTSNGNVRSLLDLSDGSLGIQLAKSHLVHYNPAKLSNDWIWSGINNKFGMVWDASKDALEINNQTVVINNTPEFINLRDDLNVTGNITSSNTFPAVYLFTHANQSQLVDGANTWTNVTFPQDFVGEPDNDVKFGINHVRNDKTNYTFTILFDGVYAINYNYDMEDTSATSGDIDVAGRVIYVNGTEIDGSVFETDIDKRLIETELSHDFLTRLKANDVIVFQFVADDAEVRISTHGTFGDQPESASVVINKIAN